MGGTGWSNLQYVSWRSEAVLPVTRGLERFMSRVDLLRRGIVLEGVTVGYNALEGFAAIVLGLAAGSVALTGFDIDSVIEVTSGVLCGGYAPIGFSATDRRWNGVLPVVQVFCSSLLRSTQSKTAEKLESRALRADAHETIVCAWLSATTLVGLGLNAVLGWWWADPWPLWRCCR